MITEVLALTRWFRLRRNAVLRFYVDFNCAGSRQVCAPQSAISKALLDRVFVYVFGHHELYFAWQVQGNLQPWRSETRVYVAAGKVAFSDFEVQPSPEIVCVSREVLVKLSFLISTCDPLRTSCVSIARNAGKVAFV